jgi:hypothetical protein
MGSVQSINEILNDSMKVKQSLTINDSMNKGWAVEKLCKTSKISAQEAECKARFLAQRLNAPNCYKFYLKCVYHLSEAEVQTALEVSTRPYVKCPAKYFSTTAKKLLIARGY